MEVKAPIVFVTGTGRGGTTLLASVLKATGAFEVYYQSSLWFWHGVMHDDESKQKFVTKRLAELRGKGKLPAFQLTVEDLTCSKGAREILKHDTRGFLERLINLKTLIIVRSAMDVVASRKARENMPEPDDLFRCYRHWLSIFAYIYMLRDMGAPHYVVPFRDLTHCHVPTIKGIIDFLERDWPLKIKKTDQDVNLYYQQAPKINAGGGGQYKKKYSCIEKEAVFETWKKMPKEFITHLQNQMEWTERILDNASRSKSKR